VTPPAIRDSLRLASEGWRWEVVERVIAAMAWQWAATGGPSVFAWASSLAIVGQLGFQVGEALRGVVSDDGGMRGYAISPKITMSKTVQFLGSSLS